MYTGLFTGEILKIDRNKKKTVVGITSGRPLGLRFNPMDKTELYICDGIIGLLSLNISTGKFNILSMKPDIPTDSSRYKFVDHLDVAQDGTVYFTGKFPPSSTLTLIRCFKLVFCTSVGNRSLEWKTTG